MTVGDGPWSTASWRSSAHELLLRWQRGGVDRSSLFRPKKGLHSVLGLEQGQPQSTSKEDGDATKGFSL